MQVNNSNRAWAMKLLSQLEGWQNYPRTEAGMTMNAEAFLSIVENEERGLWLMDQIKFGLRKFPVPLVMREIYNCKHEPADGRKPEDFMAVKYEIS